MTYLKAEFHPHPRNYLLSSKTNPSRVITLDFIQAMKTDGYCTLVYFTGLYDMLVVLRRQKSLV